MDRGDFMKILSSQQMRTLEQSAVNSGSTYTELMEAAGSAAAKRLISLGVNKNSKTAILCGCGNNGGDGFVIARRLFEHGADVSVILCKEPKTDDARFNFDRIKDNVKTFLFSNSEEQCLEIIKNADFVVDAIYGIGFRGMLDGVSAKLAKAANASKAKILSVDLPSGADCNSGAVAGECFMADFTCTFSTMKPVHVLYQSIDYCGEVFVEDVGISQKLIKHSDYEMLSTDEYIGSQLLPKRKKSSHKGTYGTLLAVCGSYGMAGAAVMSGMSALRSGVGLLNMALPRSVYSIVAQKLSESVFSPMQENGCGTISAEETDRLKALAEKSTAMLIGCGMGHNSDTETITAELLKAAKCPVIVDADGINSLVPNIDILRSLKAPVVLTPHPGEMARLLGCSVPQVQNNRKALACEFTKKYNAVLVLKGACTLVSYRGEVLVNLTGNAGMARGGSGDVLAGIIGSLLAQGIEPLRAAACGVYIHGLAGDRCRERLSQTAMLPTDMIDDLKDII